MDTSPLAIGSVYFIVAAIGIVLNALTIRAIFVQGKFRKIYSGMHILYMQPIVTDILFELIYMCYIAPSVIIQENLVENAFGRYASSILASVEIYCFYNNSLSHVSLAVNRLIVTVLLRLNFFTPKRAYLMVMGQQLLALAITAGIQYILPCCGTTLVLASFSYREVQIPGVVNYAWAMLKLPVKVACSVIPFIIYAVIICTMHSIGRRLQLQSKELIRRRRLELRFTVQFAFIAALYTISWGTFSLLPALNLSMNNGWIQGFAVIFNLLNSTTNAVMFLLNDKKKLCSCCMVATSRTPSLK